MVSASERRSHEQNRKAALLQLIARLEEMRKPAIPRRPTRSSQATRRKRLEEKRAWGKVKSWRRTPGETN